MEIGISLALSLTMLQSTIQLWRRGLPDPTRSHGAWVFLGLSVVAGLSLTPVSKWPAASLAITGFVGLFLMSSVLARRLLRRNRRRMVLGLVLSMGAPLFSLSIGADPVFFLVGSLAAFPAALGGYLALRLGFQSAPTLALFVGVLVLAAPCAASAGGASTLPCIGILLCLLPFFCWRTVKVRRLLSAQHLKGRQALKRAGIRESLYAAAWTVGVIILAHTLL